MEITTKSSFSWSYDDLSESYSTEITPENNNEIGIIIIVAISVVATIGLLFGLAVFIDCRHQKLAKSGKQTSEKTFFSISLPKFFKFRRFSNEEDSFADKMYEDGNVIA